jgi:hypothetical protein
MLRSANQQPGAAMSIEDDLFTTQTPAELRLSRALNPAPADDTRPAEQGERLYAHAVRRDQNGRAILVLDTAPRPL